MVFLDTLETENWMADVEAGSGLPPVLVEWEERDERFFWLAAPSDQAQDLGA